MRRGEVEGSIRRNALSGGDSGIPIWEPDLKSRGLVSRQTPFLRRPGFPALCILAPCQSKLELVPSPHVALPVSSILPRVSDCSGSLCGASPLNLSWGHGDGLSFCTSAQSGAGDRWAKESILKMTEIVNLSSGLKEKTFWCRETRAWKP